MKPKRRSSLEHRRRAMMKARKKSTKSKTKTKTKVKVKAVQKDAESKPRRRAVRTQTPTSKPVQKPTSKADKLPDRKDRREARVAVRRAVRTARRTTSTVSKPRTSKPVKTTDPQRTIYVGIERNTRLMIKWPSVLKNLTRQFTYDPDAGGSLSEMCRVMGRIDESKKQGTTKKLAPLNYTTAVETLKLLKQFRKSMRGAGIEYFIDLENDFALWFEEENKAKDICKQAYLHLDYDADTIQTEFPFLKKPLYPWQAAAMQFTNVATRGGRGVFLCDDTGLGKSWELAAHLAWLKHNKASGGGRAVLVCPAALRLPWERKIREATWLTTKVLTDKYCLDAYKYDVLIVSYDSLQAVKGKAKKTKRDGTKTRGRSPRLWYLSDLIEKQQRVLVLDEGHFAKEYSSVRANMCLYLSECAKHSVILTATPIKNRIKELHPLLRITRRLWTGASLKEFVRMYRNPRDQEEIAEHLVGEDGFMVRRLTPEVWLDAPKGEVVRVPVDLSNWADYEAVENRFIEWLKSRGADEDKIMRTERGYVLTQLNMLRQLSASGKIRDTIGIVNDLMSMGEQVVVFSAFNHPLKELARRFKIKTGINHKGQRWRGVGLIIGGQTDKKRMKMIDDFGAGKIGLMGVGVTAGGFGIDLPAACFAYFMDLPWSPADFEQCTGRLLRLGQTRDCQFIKLLAQRLNGIATIDDRMESIIFRKAHTFQRAIGDKGIVARVSGQDVINMTDSVAKLLIASYLRAA